MFTDKNFIKLFNTPGVSFTALKNFMADRRLTEPFSIINDVTMKFSEYDSYPEPLAEVAYHNGF